MLHKKNYHNNSFLQQNEIKRNIGLIYCFILLYLSYRFRKTTKEPKIIIEIRRIPITAPITMTVVEEDGPSVSIIHLSSFAHVRSTVAKT